MFSVLLQTILPHHLLSRIMLRFLRIRWGWLKNLQIRFVIRRFNVDMTQVENPVIIKPLFCPAFCLCTSRIKCR